MRIIDGLLDKMEKNNYLRKGLEVGVSIMKYTVSVPLAVVLGIRDYAENGDRTGGSLSHPDLADDIFQRRGLVQKIGDYYRDLVR